MLVDIVKLFEWPQVRKALYKCSPFTIYSRCIEKEGVEGKHRVRRYAVSLWVSPGECYSAVIKQTHNLCVGTKTIAAITVSP